MWSDETEHYRDAIERAASRYGLDATRVAGAVLEASGGNPHAVAQHAERGIVRGLLGVDEAAARAAGFVGAVDALLLPDVNLDIGCRVMAGVCVGQPGVAPIVESEPAPNDPPVSTRRRILSALVGLVR